LREKVDTLIAIPNGRLIEICPPNATVEEAFETADDVLRQAIQSISNIISQNGSINLDFNDVRTTMSEAGPALLAVGKGTGENRAVEAAHLPPGRIDRLHVVHEVDHQRAPAS
ncbi:MAG: hypothetical protein C4321_06330, partial [Chloroflexota bacterium]